MASIQLVRSIVKYKSPHPQDLSFPKDAVIRVTGLAQRPDLDDEDQDEDDQWYIGELLDGSKQGQFPASLTRSLTQNEMESINSVYVAPNQGTQRDLPATETTPFVDKTNEASSGISSAGPHDVAANALHTSEHKGDSGQTQPFLQTKEPLRDVAFEHYQGATESQPTSSLDAAQQETAVNASEVPSEQEAHPNEYKHKEDPISEPFRASVPPSLPTTSESIQPVPFAANEPKTAASSSETFSTPGLSQQSNAEPLSEDKAVSPIAETSNLEATTKASPLEHTEVPDPSRLSLRERIAAFNKPAEKSAPPIPRGKPGGWKRPAPVGNGEKPPMPPASNMPSLSSAENQTMTSSGNADSLTKGASSSESFSASDARSSIQMSLKERMAALQRHDAETKPAPTAPPRKLSHDLQVDPERSQEELDQDPDEASRRAALAQRMARMGGQRMGPFGGVPSSAQQPATSSEQETKSMSPTASELEQNEHAPLQADTATDNNVTAQVSLPKPTEAQEGGSATLIIPRRAAAPRSRRAPLASQSVGSPTDESQLEATSDAKDRDPSSAGILSSNPSATVVEPTTDGSTINEVRVPTPEQQNIEKSQYRPVQMPHSSNPSQQQFEPTQDPNVVQSLSEAATDIVPETGDTSFIDTTHSTAGGLSASTQLTPELVAMRANEQIQAPSSSVERQLSESQSRQGPGFEPADIALPHFSASEAPSESNQHQLATPEPLRTQRDIANPISTTTNISTDSSKVFDANLDEEIPLPNPHPNPTLPPLHGETHSGLASDNAAVSNGGSNDFSTNGSARPSFTDSSSARTQQDDQDFARERQQLEQLIGAPVPALQQDPTTLPLQSTTVDSAVVDQAPEPVQKEADYARVTPVNAKPQEVLQVGSRSELGYLASDSMPSQQAAPALGLHSEDPSSNLNPPENLTFQEKVPKDLVNQPKSAPLFIPSPSDAVSPSMGAGVSLPPDTQAQYTQTAFPEASEQDRRSEIAQRMARLGGQRIAGFPGMPTPMQQETKAPEQNKVPILPPATPSALPEAPVLPQDSQLPDLPDVAPPASEAAQTVAPRPPARRAPTLPIANDSEESHDRQTIPIQDVVTAPLASESPPARPPPSRAPPPPSL